MCLSFLLRQSISQLCILTEIGFLVLDQYLNEMSIIKHWDVFGA